MTTYLENLPYDACPEYKKGQLYLLDKRISMLTCYTELPETLKEKDLKKVEEYFWIGGYGTGIRTTALVIKDFSYKNKLRLVQCLLAKADGKTDIRYIPIAEFNKCIIKTPKTKKSKVTVSIECISSDENE
jgi:hypothetical protein